MVALPVLAVAVVGRLARHLAEVPGEPAETVPNARGVHRPRPNPTDAGSGRTRPICARSAVVAKRPEGAQIIEGSAGISDVGSGSRRRKAMNQMRTDMRMTMMIMTAKKAARIPSTVELVTMVCMSPIDLAGGSTLLESIASWNAFRWAKKPSLGLLE